MTSHSPHGQLVRVRLGGNEVTVSAGYASSKGLVPLDKPATDRYGNSLPAKPVVDLANNAPVPAGQGGKNPTGKEN